MVVVIDLIIEFLNNLKDHLYSGEGGSGGDAPSEGSNIGLAEKNNMDTIFKSTLYD